MFHSAVSVAVVLTTFLGLSTRASAACLPCDNSIYDLLPNNEGLVTLNHWNCSGNTITCSYPSTEYPGTWTECVFTGSGNVFALTASSPSVCAGSFITNGNPKCEPPNDPWNANTEECTAPYGYVGGPNSGLL